MPLKLRSRAGKLKAVKKKKMKEDSSAVRVNSSARPDPEVASVAQRRRFTAKYKLQILDEAARCTKAGEIGALLRREGLYSSQLTKWRRLQEAGRLSGLTPKKRGRRGRLKDARDHRIAELEKTNRKLQEKLQHAETVIDVQKKVSSLLGILNVPDGEEKS